MKRTCVKDVVSEACGTDAGYRNLKISEVLPKSEAHAASLFTIALHSVRGVVQRYQEEIQIRLPEYHIGKKTELLTAYGYP